MFRVLPLALLVPLSACPNIGNGPTACTNSLESALESAKGTATTADAGVLVSLQWAEVTSPATLPLDYFQQAARVDSAAQLNRFTVLSTTRAEAEFAPTDAPFSFSVNFTEPDRRGVSGCKGAHGGMDDHVVLDVTVGAADGGVRTVGTHASLDLGAF